MTGEPQKTSPLDNITVAAPCHAKWSEMSGDDRTRFCKLCTKHVYNLSAMSRVEAEALIVEKEGKLCVRFAKRADGTVISDNCPVGLRSARDRLRWIGAGVAAIFAFAGSCAAAALGNNARPSFKAWFVEQPAPTQPMVMGKMAISPPTPVTTPPVPTTPASSVDE